MDYEPKRNKTVKKTDIKKYPILTYPMNIIKNNFAETIQLFIVYIIHYKHYPTFPRNVCKSFAAQTVGYCVLNSTVC